jgi:hypothetical protein
VIRIDTAQRRARLGRRHHLATGAAAAGPVQAARGVVALHATDPATVFLSVQPRCPASVSDIEEALYEERSLMRMLGMRRTMFVVPVDAAPVIQSACTRAIAATSRRRYTQLLVAGGVGDGDWLAEVEDGAARALARRGEATGAQISADEPRLRNQVQVAQGKSYGTVQSITTWVLFLLAADGRVVRGRPRGTWTSSQWHWSPTQMWLPGGMPEIPEEEARVELVRRWLTAFGPGTVADLKWWTGWTVGQVKKALTPLAPVEVDLDGQTGLVLPEDTEPVAEPEPWVALLPALDPTPMGWSQRDWYLGPHAAALFDRSGNIGPTVWCDGRIVGGWATRPDGEVVYRLLEDVGAETTSTVDQAAERLSGWIAGIRITPRFRTPLERELSG